MARLSSELVLSLNDRVSGPARQVEGSLDRLERRQGRFGANGADRTTTRAASTMGLLARGAANVLPPFAAGLAAQEVISSAADFESMLTNIQKKAGATTAQTAKLGEEIKALATSGELAVPIEEIAAAYERGAAAGIPLDELRQFALLSAKAADAFEMSATDVGNAAAGFNKVLNVPMKDMERLFDLVNGLADSGIADESGIVAYMDQAGAMSKTFGLSVEQTAAFGAALANLKVPAERAATAMNSVLTKLLAPDALSSDGRAAFQELVGDTKAFAAAIEEDADGALVGLLKRLKALDKAKRTGIIAELFGQDHLDVVSQMVEGLDEVDRNLRYAAGQDWFGSLDKSYKLKLDDFWSKWQLLKNELAKLTIDLGTSGMPALKAGLEGAIALIHEINRGMKQLEVQIDWSAVDGAKQAVSDLGADLAALLRIDTSGSTLGKFFEDLAGVISEVAGAVERVSREMSDIAAFAQDPVGWLSKEHPDAEKRWGVTRTDPEVIARHQRTKREEAEGVEAQTRLDRDRSLDDYVGGTGLPSPEASPPAPRGERVPPPPKPVDVVQKEPHRLTAAQAYAISDVGNLGLTRDTGEEPIPTPSPERPVPVAEPAAARPSPVPRAERQRPVVEPAERPRRSAPATLTDVREPDPVNSVAPAPPARPRRPLPETFSDVREPRLYPQAVSIPVTADVSAAEAEIARIETQIDELSRTAEDVKASALIVPVPEAAATTRQIADEMERLMQRRTALEAAMSAPAPAPMSAPPPAPTLPVAPVPAEIPVTADTSAAEAEIARIEAQIDELSRTAEDVKIAARIAPSPEAVTTMRQIGDEMERLMQRRSALEAAMSEPPPTAPAVAAPPPAAAPAATPAAATPPVIPVPTPRPDFVGPITEEGQRAHLKALEFGGLIQGALSVTASPTVDASSISAAIGIVRILAGELRALPGLAENAMIAANRARANFDGLHADIED